MRAAFLIAFALTASAQIAPVLAQESKIYPWCYENSRGSKNCGFVSLAQCRAAQSGDNSGFCAANPFFNGTAPRRSRS